ncbi:DUF4382 domain-containing protein [Haloferax sulfurifontis]|uniref:DUF4382 domain-containing protein n=1 Tax=Haloferax sulfurifontis ATCC BAA-897 TaxID=662480 RepID=M0INJ2_9EURY|nr:DUF4382 domain-containing protein [Haloferax sulfurifontis]ELZ98391.1 hypothetical protein C441_00894 [Haloferax sulfurifontis ATCC BAA-897]
MVVLAGCAGGAGTMTETQTDGSADATTTASSDGGDAARTGTVNFYVSDEQNAIADFEHLNVTIERVTLVRADGDAEAEADGGDAETETETETDAETDTDAATDADAEANASVEVEIEANATANTTNGSASTNGSVGADADADADAETEEPADANDTDAAEGESSVTYEVDDATVDLTELQGENASLVGEYDVPEGNYTKVFVQVSDVNGTLKTGEQVDVKLPSNKLQLNTDFEVGNGESVDFVFDITAFEAGGSGKYVLKPVVSESGTNVPITTVGAEETADADAEAEAEAEADANAGVEAAENETGDDGERAETDAEGNLTVSFDGNVSAGENATVVVTRNGTPVENATVTINGETAGTTDADGELGVAIPGERDVTVVAVDGEAETETEFEFEVVGSAPDNPAEGGESTSLAA